MSENSREIDSKIFALTSVPFGVSYEGWTVKWWKWLSAIPKSSSPAYDASGRFCGVNQVELNAWFLAGTFSGSVNRACTIPANRAIFFPIVNSYEVMTGKKRKFSSEYEMMSHVKKQFDDVIELNLAIDGLKSSDMKKYRVTTNPFDIILPENNALDEKAGIHRMGGEGIWIFLKPLSAGEHTVSFHGIDPERGPDFETGATYNLKVQ